MRFTVLALLTFLTASVSADFLMTNTSICMGGFPFSRCITGPQVIVGVKNNTDFNCDKLMNAEDHSYINNGTAGPYGSPEVWTNDACGSGKLKFTWDNHSYFAEDSNGNHVADCVADSPLARKCNQWVGALFFNATYLCTSSIDCS